MKLIAFLLLLFGAFACTESRYIYKQPADNNLKYKVEYLFEHDGCRVYRFRDMGYYVYFTNCTGESISKPDSSSSIRNRTDWKNKAP